jgi:hypothetical protein
MNRSKGIFAAGVFAMLSLLGCGGGPPTVDVSGTATIGGKPISGGLINFQVAGERPLGGAIGPDGTFRFELPPGEYQVRIDTPPALPPGWKEGDPLPRPGPRQVPMQYGTFATSGLKASVPADAGAVELEFALP